MPQATSTTVTYLLSSGAPITLLCCLLMGICLISSSNAIHVALSLSLIPALFAASLLECLLETGFAYEQ